jgi:hypothetical protein
VAPTFLPSGYQLSESKKFQNSLKSWLTRNLVARKLNHGSNSWMIDSYRTTLKIRTRLATEQISSRIVIRIAGFHLLIDDYSLTIRGFNYHPLQTNLHPHPPATVNYSRADRATAVKGLS